MKTNSLNEQFIQQTVSVKFAQNGKEVEVKAPCIMIDTSLCNAGGLCVAMIEFGFFSVTHITTGKRIGGYFRSYEKALLLMLRLYEVAKYCGFKWSDIKNLSDSKRVAIQYFYKETPFESSSMTIKEWLSSIAKEKFAEDMDSHRAAFEIIDRKIEDLKEDDNGLLH